MPVSSVPRLFKVIRHKDGKNISGTGHVLDGVLMPNGKVIINWSGSPHSSVTIFDSFESFLAVHVKPVYNENEFLWHEGYKPSDEMNEVFETLYHRILNFKDLKDNHKTGLIGVLKAMQRKYQEITIEDE